jgi:hypothetical protein
MVMLHTTSGFLCITLEKAVGKYLLQATRKWKQDITAHFKLLPNKVRLHTTSAFSCLTL